MKKYLILLICVSMAWIACDSIIGYRPDDPGTKEDIGILNVSFNYMVPGLPQDRIRRVGLFIAYTADSMYHGQFFTSTNVSDSISRYRFYLKPGIYYYQANIICLCQNDSCKISGFSGQNGLKSTGGKVRIIKNEVTEVSTQFH